MKLNLNFFKSLALNTFVQISGKFTVTKHFFKENKINKKFLALMLIITLLMPIFLFGDWAKSAAASLSNLASHDKERFQRLIFIRQVIKIVYIVRMKTSVLCEL